MDRIPDELLLEILGRALDVPGTSNKLREFKLLRLVNRRFESLVTTRERSIVSTAIEVKGLCPISKAFPPAYFRLRSGSFDTAERVSSATYEWFFEIDKRQSIIDALIRSTERASHGLLDGENRRNNLQPLQLGLLVLLRLSDIQLPEDQLAFVKSLLPSAICSLVTVFHIALRNIEVSNPEMYRLFDEIEEGSREWQVTYATYTQKIPSEGPQHLKEELWKSHFAFGQTRPAYLRELLEEDDSHRLQEFLAFVYMTVHFDTAEVHEELRAFMHVLAKAFAPFEKDPERFPWSSRMAGNLERSDDILADGVVRGMDEETLFGMLRQLG